MGEIVKSTGNSGSSSTDILQSLAGRGPSDHPSSAGQLLITADLQDLGHWDAGGTHSLDDRRFGMHVLSGACFEVNGEPTVETDPDDNCRTPGPLRFSGENGLPECFSRYRNSSPVIG